MDDARVSRVQTQEVLGAEAYMLFYRVVEHPVAVQLRQKIKAREAAVSFRFVLLRSFVRSLTRSLNWIVFHDLP
eukprot:scaffold90369_cov49-Attheya_sp.AAC.5